MAATPGLSGVGFWCYHVRGRSLTFLFSMSPICGHTELPAVLGWGPFPAPAVGGFLQKPWGSAGTPGTEESPFNSVSTLEVCYGTSVVPFGLSHLFPQSRAQEIVCK